MGTGPIGCFANVIGANTKQRRRTMLATQLKKERKSDLRRLTLTPSPRNCPVFRGLCDKRHHLWRSRRYLRQDFRIRIPCHETHISAKQPRASTPSRLSQTYGNPRWPQHFARTSCPRSQVSFCIKASPAHPFGQYERMVR